MVVLVGLVMVVLVGLVMLGLVLLFVMVDLNMDMDYGFYIK